MTDEDIIARIPDDEPIKIWCPVCRQPWPCMPRGARLHHHCGAEWDNDEAGMIYYEAFVAGWRANDKSMEEGMRSL